MWQMLLVSTPYPLGMPLCSPDRWFLAHCQPPKSNPWLSLILLPKGFLHTVVACITAEKHNRKKYWQVNLSACSQAFIWWRMGYGRLSPCFPVVPGNNSESCSTGFLRMSPLRQNFCCLQWYVAYEHTFSWFFSSFWLTFLLYCLTA